MSPTSLAHLLFPFFLYCSTAIAKSNTSTHVHAYTWNACQHGMQILVCLKKNERGEKAAPGVIDENGSEFFFPKTHLI